MTAPTLEQRVAHLEAALEQVINLLQSNPTVISGSTQSNSTTPLADALANGLPFGVFADDPYFDEIIQRMRAERELDADNPAYT